MEIVHNALLEFMVNDVNTHVPCSVRNAQVKHSVLLARMVTLVIIVANNAVTVRIILLVISKRVNVNTVQMECMEASASFINVLRIVSMCHVTQIVACVTTAAKKVIGESIAISVVHIIASITRVLKR
jgi:hypothetical protein